MLEGHRKIAHGVANPSNESIEMILNRIPLNYYCESFPLTADRVQKIASQVLALMAKQHAQVQDGDQKRMTILKKEIYRYSPSEEQLNPILHHLIAVSKVACIGPLLLSNAELDATLRYMVVSGIIAGFESNYDYFAIFSP